MTNTTPIKEYDYLIVGQGIAGSLLAHFLEQEEQRILVFDAAHHLAASKVAAGLVNPITGRHFIKSWRVDELIPFALKTYKALEQQFDCTIFEVKEVTMLFNSIQTENNWLVRSGNADVQAYIADQFDADLYASFLEDMIGGVSFQQSGRVRLKPFIETYANYLRQANRLVSTNFDYQQLEVQPQYVQYQNYRAKGILFAEGFQSQYNPFFEYLPFVPTKGDILLVKIPNYPARDKLVKHGVFIVPIEEATEPDLYWVGSTYHREFKDPFPKESQKEVLTNRLKRVLKLPFEVLEHQSAVRPTVRDRRPFIGQHPNGDPLYLFTGMGAKGSYLAPYFAHHFVQYLLHNVALDPSVSIRRYEKYLTR